MPTRWHPSSQVGARRSATRFLEPPNAIRESYFRRSREGPGSRIGFNDRDITEAVAPIARAALRPDLKELLARAEEFILGSLVELLGAHADVSYFAPLLKIARDQTGGLDVITLNCDLTVETAAANEGITVNRGVESWNPGGFLEFPSIDGVLNLMKLHGRWTGGRRRPQMNRAPAYLRSVSKFFPPNLARLRGDRCIRSCRGSWSVIERSWRLTGRRSFSTLRRGRHCCAQIT